MTNLSFLRKRCNPALFAVFLAVFAVTGTAYGQDVVKMEVDNILSEKNPYDNFADAIADDDNLPDVASHVTFTIEGTHIVPSITDKYAGFVIARHKFDDFDEDRLFTGLKNVTLSGSGGAILDGDNMGLVLYMSGNRDGSNPVAMSLKNLTIQKGEFTYEGTGSVMSYGGGGTFLNFSTFNLENVVFDRNTVIESNHAGTAIGAGGGGAYFRNSPIGNATLTGVSFTNNIAQSARSAALGGGLDVSSIDTFAYNGGEVSNNLAKGTSAAGGGIWLRNFGQDSSADETPVTFNAVTFEGNHAIATGTNTNTRGGAIWIGDTRGENILGNLAPTGATNNGKVEFSDVLFKNNLANAGNNGIAEGGGVYTMSAFQMDHSWFVGNTATGGNEAVGGGLRVNGQRQLKDIDIATINDTKFIGNTAKSAQEAYGGGFFIAGGSGIWNDAMGNVKLDRITLDSNFATGTGTDSVALGAGGIVKNVGNFTFTNGKVFDNTTKADNQAKGGGLYLTYIKNDIDITNVWFDGNQAISKSFEAFGGALMIDNQAQGAWSGGGVIKLNDVAFTNNSVTSGGNVGVAGNRGGLGGAIYTDSSMEISGNSLFYDNKANGVKNDIALHSASGITLTLSPGKGKTISFDGGITGGGGATENTVKMTGGGTIAFTNEDGAIQVFSDQLKAVVGYGTELQTGMFHDNGWNSNVTITHDTAIKFENGSIWSINHANGYNGENVLLGYGDEIEWDWGTTQDIFAKAQAALDNGNAMNSLFDYYLDYDASTFDVFLRGQLRENANLSPTATMAAAFVQPGRMFTGTKNQFDTFRHQWQPYSRWQLDYLGQSSRQSGFGGGAAWVNWVGRNNEYTTNFAPAIGQKMKLNSNGVQLGTDVFRTACVQVGIMFGYESHEASILNDRAVANDLYVGLYTQRLLGRSWDVRGSLGYGQQGYTSRRFDVGGLNTATFNGNTLESTLELGRRLQLHRGLAFRPVIGLDLLNTVVDAHNETGGPNAVAFSKSSLTQALIRFGSDVNWKRFQRLALNGGAYYSHNFADNDHTRVWVTQNGVTQKADGTKLGRSVFTVNAGGNWYFDNACRYSLFGNYFGDFYTDRDGKPMGHTGMVGLSAKF